jgi:transcriptional regulator of arginine metabolism
MARNFKIPITQTLQSLENGTKVEKKEQTGNLSGKMYIFAENKCIKIHMKRKQLRHEAIRRIINDGRAGNQDALLGLIRSEGFECTQATLSRDLHEMKIVKVPDSDKGYIYVPASGKLLVPEKKQSKASHLADGFRDLNISANLGVIRTLPGYASSIALVIDNARHELILGTIAGDDTILVVLKENVTKDEVKKALAKILPFVKNKI